MKKLAIVVNQSINAPSFRELQEILEKRDIDIDYIDVSLYEITDFAKDPTVQRMIDAGVVYFRTGIEPVTRFRLAQYLSEQGVQLINPGVGKLGYTMNKINQMTIMHEQGVQVPRTLTSFPMKDQYENIIERIGRPFVLKAPHGSKGEHVFLVEDRYAFEEALTSKPQFGYLVQEYIPNAGDYRVFVVGNDVPTMYRRIPKGVDFRANTSQGGTAEPVIEGELFNRIADIALRAARALDLAIAGVDIIEHKETGELYCIEANKNSGRIKSLEEMTGVNINQKIADYLVARISG